jgi:hypothetical protein
VSAVTVISALFILQCAMFDSLGKTASLLFGAFLDRVRVRDIGKYSVTRQLEPSESQRVH